MKRSGPIPCLDGVRAVAVLIVFFSHNGLAWIVPGDLGVTIFFVLSGFLITTLMRQEIADTGGLAIGPFYMRRLLRLYPPLLIATVLAMAISLFGFSDVEFSAAGVASVVLYFSNYWMVLTGADAGVPAGLGVTWSLAVEEHFYMLYPLVATAMLVLLPARRAVVFALLCVGFSLWRAVLYYGFEVSELYLKMATDARIDAILYGCLMGAVYNPWLDDAVRRRPRTDFAIGAACVAVLLATLLIRDEVFRDVARNGLRAAALMPLIYFVVLYGDRWLTAPLRWAPLAYIGQISYLFYLVHDQFLVALRDSAPQLAEWQVGIGSFALTLVTCELARRYVENPVARMRKRLRQIKVSPASPAAEGPAAERAMRDRQPDASTPAGR